MNRGEIRRLARKRLGETTAAFWTDDELNGWFNDAGHDIALKTNAIKDVGDIASVEGVAEYKLTTYFPDILSVERVYFKMDGKNFLPLTKQNHKEMDILFPGWLSFDSATPQNYLYEYERNKTLTLSPKPNASNAGTGYIRIYYSKDFTDVTADTTVISFDAILQKAMCDYIVAYGYEARGYLTKASATWKEYDRKILGYKALKGMNDDDDCDSTIKPYKGVS